MTLFTPFSIKIISPKLFKTHTMFSTNQYSNCYVPIHTYTLNTKYKQTPNINHIYKYKIQIGGDSVGLEIKACTCLQ